MRYDGRFFAPVRINLIANNFLPPLSLFPLPLGEGQGEGTTGLTTEKLNKTSSRPSPSPHPSPKGRGRKSYRRRFFFFFFFRDGPAGKPGIPPIIASPPLPSMPGMPAARRIIFPPNPLRPPPLNMPCIMRRISVYCLISEFTCATVVPEPRAIRRRRLAFRIT